MSGLMTSLLVEHLARACREHLLAEKWLFAPSRRAAHQWLDQVTRAGGPLVNVRVRTTRSAALEVLAEDLAAGDLRVASSAMRTLVVAEAWDRAMRADGYLGSAAPSPRLLELAARTLMDLRLAGVRPDDLDPKRFEHPVKGAELRRLLASYEEILGRRGLIDHADTMRLAAAKLAAGGPPPGDRIILVPADLRLSPLESRLVEALGGSAMIRLEADPPETSPAALENGPGRIVAAVGETNEVREALRACMAGEIPLDDVEILYSAAEPYVPILYETAQRVFGIEAEHDLGVPVTFAEGVPARASRPGRLLAAWLAWIDEGYPESSLARMLQAGLLRTQAQSEADAVGRARLVSALRAAGIWFGRDRYVRCVRDHLAGLERRIGSGRESEDELPQWQRERLERDAQAARALLALIEPLMDASPPREAPPARLVSAAAILVGDMAQTGSALDRLARQHLLREIKAMADALEGTGATPPGFDARQWLRALPDELRVGGSAPLPGHVHAAPVRGGGHSGRPHTMILGLDDGRFPPGGRQDPLLLDGERQRLSDDLATSGRRLGEHVQDFNRLLARLHGAITLSWCCRNVADDSEMFAAPQVLAAYRTISGDATGDQSALRKWLGPAASFAPAGIDGCLDMGEWWLCRGAEERAVNLPALMEAAFPHLLRGRIAAKERASDAFTIFDGLVDDPGPELDPRRPVGPILSATSSLKTLGRCPLAYFQEQVLRVRPPEEAKIDRQRWLDHKDFGSLLHEILYDFVGLLVEEASWPPRTDRDQERIAAIVDERATAWRARVPSPTPEAYERQRQELRRAGEIFVNEQAVHAAGWTPVFLEASIGARPEARATAIDAPDPVALEISPGVTVRARARIDRIDRRDGAAAAPRFTIWDYKSGGYVVPWDPPDLFDRGRLLQHVLYMAVAESVLRERFGDGARVDGFSFLFPSVRAHGRRVPFPSTIVPEGLEIIERLCRLPAEGAFPATDKAEDCKYCDHRRACRAAYRDLEELCDASKRKLRNKDNCAPKPFAELRLGT